jgi:O-antigen/teichoic acid export membrane protein
VRAQIEMTNATLVATAKKLYNAWKHLVSLVSQDRVLSLADQAVVSGTNFLTTFFVARWSNSSQLGIYAVTMSVVLALTYFQESLISHPYTIQRHNPEDTSAERAGASLALSVVFSGACILALCLIALCLLEWMPGSEMATIVWIVAAILAFVLIRDFARRFAFAHLDMLTALYIDLAVAIIQVSVLCWLGISGRMSAITACAALGIACVFPTAAWLYSARTRFRFRTTHLQSVLKQTWALGKWLLAGRLVVTVQGYMIYWILMIIGGASITGVYAACMSVLGFVNPLLIGLGNSFMPRSVLAWNTGGGPKLWREAIQNSMLVGALMIAMTITVLVAGESVIGLLYHGPEFRGLGPTLIVLALGLFFGALGTPASVGLATMQQARLIVVAATASAVVAIILVALLMTKWGLSGAAYGLLGGALAAAIGRWVSFYFAVPRTSDPRHVIRVLQDFAKGIDDSRCEIVRIGEGGHAELSALMSNDQKPLWHTYPMLVTKLYKPEPITVPEMVQAQFESLSSLHTALDGRKINGWQISVPRPLHICKSPLGLLMTPVPGKTLDACVASTSDDLSVQLLVDAARSVAIAMQMCWSAGGRHGDLSISNILLDFKAKKISLIDAGTVDSCHSCNDGLGDYAVPSELAHLLAHVACDVMHLVAGEPARLVKELFVETVLLTIIEDIRSEEEKLRLLNEIWNCLEQHLTEFLEQSWSVKGVVHRFGKTIVTNRARSILKRVRRSSEYFDEGSRECNFRAGRAARAVVS